MKVCVRCATPRLDGSFYTDGSHPDDVCKPCIHRPRRTRVSVLKTRQKRTRTAIHLVVQQAQRNGDPFVYLISAGRNTKIGFSTDVIRRLRELETASSAPIQLIAVAPGGRQLEQALHAEFVCLRTRREWFRDRRHLIVPRFSRLTGAMIFLPGYVQQDAPLDVIE